MNNNNHVKAMSKFEFPNNFKADIIKEVLTHLYHEVAVWFDAKDIELTSMRSKV